MDLNKSLKQANEQGYHYISQKQPEYLQHCLIRNSEMMNEKEAIWLGDRFGGLTRKEFKSETWFWKGK